MAEVIIENKRVRVSDTDAIGKGGEADVFDLGNGRVLKIFKTETHPDVALDPHAQKAARERIAAHQKKLPALLALLGGKLPPSVVLPEALATNTEGKVAGYTMPFLSGTEVLLRYGQRTFRQNVTTEDAIALLRDLHTTVQAVHAAGAVIGDFNDLNVLAKGRQAFVIDADSFQFGSFPCLTYTTTFVDPLNCDPNADAPLLVSPHSPNSDWYAFAVMLMQTLLFVGPYGGVFRPSDPKNNISHNKRPLRRITVFHPEVKYPKPAVPLNRLSDDVLDQFHRTFIKDERGVFPARLLDRLRWTKCTACGEEHGRPTCPSCSAVAPSAVKTTTSVHGRVTATRLFPTGRQEGARILRAEAHEGKVFWLYRQGNEFRREDGALVGTNLPADPYMRIRLREAETFLGQGGLVVHLHKKADRLDVDFTGKPPTATSAYDINAKNIFWVHNGVLYWDKSSGPTMVGSVLRGHTLLWAGSSFGFGFYRAGSLNVAFVFTAGSLTLNDNVKLPPIAGQLLGATCTFAKDRVWVFTSSQEGSRTINCCTLVRASGAVEATAQAEQGDGSWLGQIHGGVAAGNAMLMPTDDGVVQIRPENGQLVESEKFPDTESFVDSGSKLLVGADGLYVVTAKEITRLVIARS